MYEDFHVTDHWTQEDLHCRWTANVVAIATRHADAVDIRFEVNGRPVWIAMPADGLGGAERTSGHVITDRLAAQVAGRYLKQAAENGYDNGREMYTMSVAEVLEQVEAVMEEAGHSTLLPELPVMPRARPSRSCSAAESRRLPWAQRNAHWVNPLKEALLQ